MTAPIDRRDFVVAGAALASSATLSPASYARVLGANERVGIGLIGFGLIGKRHVLTYRDLADATLVGVSDAHRGRSAEGRALMGGSAKEYRDFRELFDDKNMDAVVVATPDHWHALMSMMACAAGKDVYVEKPLSLTVAEGRWMLDVARRHRRVVQVGTQQRSGTHYQRARDLLRGGHIGKIMSVRITNVRNIHPGFGKPPDENPPPDLDWEAWLGPAPHRPYNRNRSLYHFRWIWDYSGGQLTNLGSHSLDIVDWVLGLDKLRSVVSVGGRLCLQDAGETPDTQDTLWQFDGWTASCTLRECSAGPRPLYHLEFFGTKGSLGLNRSGFRVFPDADVPPDSLIPQFGGAHPIGGPKSAPTTSTSKLRTPAIEDRTGDERSQFTEHARNFLDCIKTRQEPISDIASAHRTAQACHLANLSLRLGRKIRVDDKQTPIDDPQATAALTRPYRAPWDAVLKSLGV